MKFRFRQWGTDDWTQVDVDGELSAEALAILGSGLRRYHCQLLVNDRWENLGE